MSKRYRTWTPEQSYLLPPSPMDWLPEGHLAYFVLEVVRELDLGAIEGAIQAKDPRGERPYAPRMMTALLLYAYCSGVFSSRKIAKATVEDVAFRVITGGTHPHFTTINSFRLDHRDALAGLFVQVLRLCERAGLRTVGHVSLDGSRVQANASKHKAMSYMRMSQEEKRLSAEIEALLRKADETDAREDAEHGDGDGFQDLPAELQRREGRRAKIRAAKEALEKEAAEARAATLRENADRLRAQAVEEAFPPRRRRAAATLAAKADQQAEELAPRQNDDDDEGGGTASATQLPLHRVAATPDGKPKPKAQRNFTDSDSRIMFRNGVVMQGYNGQAMVSEDQLIVAHGLTNDGTDAAHLVPMLERVRENCGRLPTALTADSAYLSEANVDYCAAQKVDAYIAVRRVDEMQLDFPPSTSSGRMRFLMSVKLKSKSGRELYAKRKTLAEPVFGQIKAAMGFQRFSLRGLLKTASEWGIVCACHNLLKLFRRRVILASANPA